MKKGKKKNAQKRVKKSIVKRNRKIDKRGNVSGKSNSSSRNKKIGIKKQSKQKPRTTSRNNRSIKAKTWFAHLQWKEITKEDYQGVPEGITRIKNVKRIIPVPYPIGEKRLRENYLEEIIRYEQEVLDDISDNTSGALGFKFIDIKRVEPFKTQKVNTKQKNTSKKITSDIWGIK